MEAYSRERGSALSHNGGAIIDEDGIVIGRHNGVHQFTIGQRKGLGFAAGKPLYVLSIDRENNRVVVGDDESLRSTTCEVENVNWIARQASNEALRAAVKIRHKHIPADATVTLLDHARGRVTS